MHLNVNEAALDVVEWEVMRACHGLVKWMPFKSDWGRGAGGSGSVPSKSGWESNWGREAGGR